MAVNIKFDLSGNPEPSTIVLAKRNGDKLGQLDVNPKSIELSDKFNDASEISFTLNKYIDGKLTNLWDKVVDFKLVWCKEWDMWFEIKVELDEETETVKTVLCTQLGQAELSQIKLHNIEINTEDDIARDDYKITILYDEYDSEASLLNRLLKDKAPHYSIAHVDSTIKNIQRTFSFDGTSIKDAFDEIAEEIGCLFIYNSGSDENGKPQRTISVYDLQQNCLNTECKYRGEFTDKCPKCGSTNIEYGYGEDTLIFVTSDQLASDGIELKTDVDSVKNCFKLKAGDDLMTATIRNCNPNGSDYIWYFSDAVKEDMSTELVERIESYDEQYKYHYNDSVSDIDSDILNKYNTLVEKYKVYYNTTSSCINCDYEGNFEHKCPECGSENILTGKNLQSISTPITGYSALMNAYYNAVDLGLYLKSALMPTITMSDTSAKEQAELLTSSALSPVAVNTENIESISESTAKSAVLSIAKVIVKPTYKVEITTSSYDKDTYTWTGGFTVTNYSDEDDTADSDIVSVKVNNDTETFIKQKIDKALNKDNTDDYSISGLFEKEYDDFCAELKKYALNPLKSFYDSCDTCLNILIDSEAGNKDKKPDLYESLYEPYYNKSSAIAKEIKDRENEIAIIEGVWDKTDENNPELITKGLQQYIEECRNNIQDALDFEKYLGEKLWLEFCCYRREDTYSNDNYISDGLNNAELFERALEFIEVAENEIFKSAELQHSISTSLNNLLAIEKFKPLVDSFEVGNWIRVQVDNKIFKLRLLEYDIDFGNFENISVEFSDVTKIKNSVSDVKSVVEQASSMASSYDAIARQAKQGNNVQNTVDKWIANGLNSALVRIQNNNREEIILTENGLLCRSYDEITDSYSPEQVRLTHNIIAYTDDDWKTVRQAIGKHDYKLFDDSDGVRDWVDKTGYGITANFLTAGVVSGSQMVGGDIYSNNYSISKKEGSHLNLEDGTFSFAGGKLVYNGNDLIVDGKITVATEGTIACWNVNKDSLWKGSEVFGNSIGMYFGTEGLSLGEKFKVDNEGSMTATSGTIGGWLIEPNYIGLEKWDENDCSNNVAMSSTGVNAYVSALGGYDSCLLYFKDKFAVDTNGKLYATDAYIEGKLNATEGNFGNFTINSSGFGSVSKTETNDSGIWFKSNPTEGNYFINCANYGDSSKYFRVSADGTVHASNADISGVINATTGSFSDSVTIGGTEITAGALKDLYSYATGGTGTPITQINATIGEISGLKIDSTQNRLYYKQSDDNYTSIGLKSIEIVKDEQGYFRAGLLEGDSNPLGVAINSGYNTFALNSSSGSLTGTWTLDSEGILTSDKNLKNSIELLSEKYSVLFDNLNPVRFKYNNGTSNRYHTGFIAQELQQAIIESNLSEQEVAALCTVETNEKDSGYMGIRYGELVALCVNEIQKLKLQIKELKGV